MTELIAQEDRKNELLSFGFPKVFIENIGKIPQLHYRVEDVDGAYFYLPTIFNYEILKNKTLIPIYDCGESFYVLTYDNEVKEIIHFELENDIIYTNYGENFKLLLMDIMIEYFDATVDDEISVENFILIGDKIGFEQSEALFNLRNLSIIEYNSKYEKKEEWRNEIAKELKIL